MWDVGHQLPGHRGAGEDHDTGVDVAVEGDGVAPGQQLLQVEAHLDEQEVGCSLPGGKGLKPGRHARTEPASVALCSTELAQVLDHGAHGELAGAGARSWASP